MHALTLFAAIVLAIWLYLYFARGGFWLVRALLPPRTHAAAAVAAVVPARNESACIARAVTSLLAQDMVALHVFVVDDASTDGTAERALSAAAAGNAGSRLTVVPGAPLPPGWTGKLWAVQQGVDHALRTSPDYILLTDADIEHAPSTVSNLVGISDGKFDLVSFMVKLHCRSFAEKLLIPAFVYFFFQLYPPAWIRNVRRKTAGAAGGCMLIRPSALQAMGGIAAIRSEVIDDCALARAVKRSGGRVWLGLTASSESIRRYDSFSEIGRMISRTAFNQLHHSVWLLAATILGLLVTYVAPIALLGFQQGAAIVLAAVASALLVLSYLPMVRLYRIHPLWALTLPLAAVFYLGATVWSAVQYWRGRGGQWKDRAQDGRSPG